VYSSKIMGKNPINKLGDRCPSVKCIQQFILNVG
jgi:hypothetical protein